MKINIHKILYGIILVVAIVLIVPVINYIGIAFGFNGPTLPPPQGSGAITAGPGPAFNVGINTALPTTAKLAITSPGLPAIDTDPTGGTAGRIIGLATTVSQFNLMNGDDAASKAYVDAQGGGGGGSMVLFYKTSQTGGGPVTPQPPSCPSGWTGVSGLSGVTPGYGPHYLGLLNYGWLTGSGQQGGFGAGAPPSGSAYILNSVGIGSDSVCSQSQTSVANFSSIYNNAIQSGFSNTPADACFADTTTGITECNRCVVCKK